MAAVESRRIATVLFDGFELLDVCGPLEVFGGAGRPFSITLVGPSAGPVRSAQGPALVAEVPYGEAPPPDIVLVPGGPGTRALVSDGTFLRGLARWAATARIVASVCTGSGVLAAAGLLDGYRATSNKRAFAWARAQGPGVTWLPRARWVEDRDRWTSSGVSAGIDMALALVARLHGEASADEIADRVEYERCRDADHDPFAVKAGLVDG